MTRWKLPTSVSIGPVFPLGLKLQGATRTASTLMQGYLVSIGSRLLHLCFDFLIAFLFYSILLLFYYYSREACMKRDGNGNGSGNGNGNGSVKVKVRVKVEVEDMRM